MTLPPGRPRLATRPVRSGSTIPTRTTGIDDVAALAARAACVLVTRIMSTFIATSSAARPGKRSSRPSAFRRSMTIFWPSTYPRSRNPVRNASWAGSAAERASSVRTPIRGSFPACCASTPRGVARKPRVSRKARRSIMAGILAPGVRLRFGVVVAGGAEGQAVPEVVGPALVSRCDVVAAARRAAAVPALDGGAGALPAPSGRGVAAPGLQAGQARRRSRLARFGYPPIGSPRPRSGCGTAA